MCALDYSLLLDLLSHVSVRLQCETEVEGVTKDEREVDGGKRERILKKKQGGSNGDKEQKERNKWMQVR